MAIAARGLDRGLGADHRKHGEGMDTAGCLQVGQVGQIHAPAKAKEGSSSRLKFRAVRKASQSHQLRLATAPSTAQIGSCICTNHGFPSSWMNGPQQQVLALTVDAWCRSWPVEGKSDEDVQGCVRLKNRGHLFPHSCACVVTVTSNGRCFNGCKAQSARRFCDLRAKNDR